MPPPVFTIDLYNGPVALGAQILASPPAGHRYIVTSADCRWVGNTQDAPPVLHLYNAGSFGAPFFVLESPTVRSNVTYSWRGRQVCDNPESIVSSASGIDWYVAMTGYDLTLP